MKKIFIILFFLIGQKFLFAQTSIYHPFPDSNAVWGVGSSCIDVLCGDGADTRYYYIGDTIIGSYLYKKLFGFVVSSTNNSCCTPSSLIYSGLVGCLRQDTTTRKVYFNTDPSVYSDTILYDFTLQAGDTCKTLACLNCQSNGMVIRSIDSILIGAFYRKRYNFDTLGTCSLSFIEGIGSTGGILGFCTFFEVGSELYCFSENGILLYNGSHCQGSPYSGPCNALYSNTNDYSSGRTIKIFPNPVSDILNIDHNFSDALEINLIDVFGTTHYKNQIESGKTSFLYLSELSAGLYFLRAFNKKEYIVKKIVIQK